MKATVILLVLAMLLAGCVSAAERERRATPSPIPSGLVCNFAPHEVHDVKTENRDGSLYLTGYYLNSCAFPTNVEIRVTAREYSGAIVRTFTFYPAGIVSIAPGDRVRFDEYVGPQNRIAGVSHAVVQHRSW
jgi:hypothetical protein